LWYLDGLCDVACWGVSILGSGEATQVSAAAEQLARAALARI
jgi:hypothetical protein